MLRRPPIVSQPGHPGRLAAPPCWLRPESVHSVRGLLWYRAIQLGHPSRLCHSFQSVPDIRQNGGPVSPSSHPQTRPLSPSTPLKPAAVTLDIASMLGVVVGAGKIHQVATLWRGVRRIYFRWRKVQRRGGRANVGSGEALGARGVCTEA